jgi:Carbohydrate binding domain (family 11)/PHP domain
VLGLDPTRHPGRTIDVLLSDLPALIRMRRTIWVLLLIVAAAFGLRVFLWKPFPVVGSSSPDQDGRIAGVVHVHTQHSDGRGTPEQVIAAAHAAGLDYLVITDHNAFDAKPFEGYSGKLLVIVGTEISTRSGHIIAVGLPEPAFRFSDDAAEVLEDIDTLGGVAMIAHPDSPRPEFRWTQWDLPGAWGIELLNGDTQWRSIGVIDTVRLLTTYPLNPSYALLGILHRPDSTLERWDRLLASRDTPMIAGADAHGFPSYERLFSVARNHLVPEHPPSGDAQVDTAAIVTALRRGRGYVGIDALASTRGFSFVAEAGGRRWTMGDLVPADPRPRLRAGGALPERAMVTLYRDGGVIKEAAGELEWPDATAGVYRVEVRLPGWDVPWILSNAIYVLDPVAQDARQRRGRVPPPIVAETTQVLDDFEAGGRFEPAADTSTTLDRIATVPDSGDRGSVARLRFTLGTPTTAIPSPFAALVNLQPRDLSTNRGLVFSIKGDAARRVWVQVRDDNPRSEDGTEWWYASVRTSTEWRRVAVPFDRFRTRDPRTDGTLDVKNTRGIVFLVDIGVAKPGTEGVIWVDDIGVY